jgi:HEAT repeat protein
MKAVTWFGVILVCALSVCPGPWGDWAIAEASPETILKEANQTFVQGEFQKTLELVEPLLQTSSALREPARLKVLSLVRLGKTKDGVEAFDQFVKAIGHQDEALLREMAIQSILPFRSDMREQVRGSAYSALKEIQSSEVLGNFQDGLSDGSGMIRVLVAEGMGIFPEGRKLESFRGALNDQAGLVRVTVLKAFGRSGDITTIPLIMPFLSDKQEAVQVAAAAALYRLGQKDQWDRVERATNVQEGYERGSALRMIGEIGDPRGLPLLELGLRDKQPSIRAAAAASLGKLGLPEGVPLLIGALSEPVPAVRSVAAVMLGELKSEEAIPALTRALQDKNMGVKAAAVAGLLELNSPFRIVAETVRELIGQQNPGLRSSAAKALAHGRPRDVVGTLLLMLNDPVPKPRISAARSLGRVAGREVIPQLKDLLKDPNESLRATAAGAIVRILSNPPQT